MVYPANAFDSHLRGDWVPLGSSPTKSQKKKKRLTTALLTQSASQVKNASCSFILSNWDLLNKVASSKAGGKNLPGSFYN